MKRYTNNFEFQAFYTLSWDKSDDDNERDPFTLRYAKVTDLDAEYGYSDRDQRHRFNAYVLWVAPGRDQRERELAVPLGAAEVDHGRRARTPAHAAGPDQHGRQRHGAQPRAEGQPVQLVQPARSRGRSSSGAVTIEPIVEVFNLFNSKNLKKPESTSLLFNFDGTVQSGLGDPRQVQFGVRVLF